MWNQTAKIIVDKRNNFPLKASNMNLKYQYLKSKLYSTLCSGSSNNGPWIDFIRISLNNAEMKFTLKANIRQIFNMNLLFSLKSIIKQQFNNMLENPIRAPKKQFMNIIYIQQEYLNILMHLMYLFIIIHD